MALWLTFTTAFAIIGATRKPPISESARRDALSVVADPEVASSDISEVIRTRRLEVLDQHGKSHLVAAMEDDAMRLTVGSSGTKQGVVITASSRSAGLVCQSERDVLMLDAEAMSMTVIDPSQPPDAPMRGVIRLGKSEAGGGQIEVFNSIGNISGTVRQDKEGHGAFTVHERDGNPTGLLSTNLVASRAIEIADDDGRPAFSLGHSGSGADRTTRMEMRDGNGDLRLLVASTSTYGLAAVYGDTGSISLGNDGIGVRPLRPENAALRKRGIGPAASEEERKRYEDALVDPATVQVHAGGIDVFNPLGERVVSVQSNKANDGAVYVNDATGNKRNLLVPEFFDD